MNERTMKPMEWWAVKSFSGYSFFLNEAYANKEAEKEKNKVIHVREVFMTDEHLMRNLIAQSEIIAELKEDNKVMKEVLGFYSDISSEDKCKAYESDMGDKARGALSKLKVKYD